MFGAESCSLRLATVLPLHVNNVCATALNNTCSMSAMNVPDELLLWTVYMNPTVVLLVGTVTFVHWMVVLTPTLGDADGMVVGKNRIDDGANGTKVGSNDIVGSGVSVGNIEGDEETLGAFETDG